LLSPTILLRTPIPNNNNDDENIQLRMKCDIVGVVDDADRI
jgi:hypothetical protein